MTTDQTNPIYSRAYDTALIFVDEFPGERPEADWISEAWSIDGCPGTYDDYADAVRQHVARITAPQTGTETAYAAEDVHRGRF